jgi:hypothetical protein
VRWEYYGNAINIQHNHNPNPMPELAMVTEQTLKAKTSLAPVIGIIGWA